MKFQELDLIEPILRSLKEEGYDTPTPIQQQSIPHSLEGRDLLACAQTGTGKTAAFAIPILQNLHKRLGSHPSDRQIKALILTPTRELAIQIEESFQNYGRHLQLRKLVIFGGVGQTPQENALRKGVDILVATPGRLLDLMNQGIVNLRHIEFFVLDEADRMLDMGFIHDVRKVIKVLPEKRQTLFFSATMPPEIAKLAHDILTDPIKVAVTPVSSTVDAIEQSIFFVGKKQKRKLLIHLLKTADITNALVFTRTKHGANRVAQELGRTGIKAMAIHGNKSQTARQQALGKFKTGDIRVLVATDIAARGIDLEELSHVINFDLPNIPESYVHRIGRTGRAGASGIAFSFCDDEEKEYLRDIQRLIKKQIPVVEDHPFPLGGTYEDDEAPSHSDRPERQPNRGQRSSNPSFQRRNRPERRPSNNQRSNDSPEGGTQTESRPQRENQRQGQGGRPGQQQRSRPDRRPSNNRDAAPNGGQEERQRRLDNPPKEQPASQDQPAAKKQEEKKENTSKWSSLFKETAGKKGFIIKSDRDENKKKWQGGGNPNKGGGGRPNRRGGKR
ncbi:MAG: DEAD/DEAH box helicase [Saprospiraceae bacterium]